jgi:hypothetical protein
MQNAIELYAQFSRINRNLLYSKVIAHPDFPFHDGPDDSALGRWFIIVTGDYEAPACNDSLDIIVNNIKMSEKYNDTQINRIYEIYIEEINNILNEQKLVPETVDKTDLINKFNCSICIENIVNICYSSCGHLLCSTCDSKLLIRKCPTCRTPIEKTIKMFY